MSIFDLHSSVVTDYEDYVRSFLSIADDRIRDFVEKRLIEDDTFWPDALLQLNPSFKRADSVDDLCAQGFLSTQTAQIFRTNSNEPFILYQHQCDAIRLAAKKRSYVVTSGTGSGKSLTYFIPIFDAVIRTPSPLPKVRAIVIYPMNALVNSQYESLCQLAENYRRRTGAPLPVRFEKYTGQEPLETKQRIQHEPPHILLTNFMMLEMILLRPQESDFVDRGRAGLDFLVLDELHTYRGRQGADVAMLVRRLKERCGNPGLLHIGTSATMVADPSATGSQRKEAVSEFAGRLFGIPLAPDSVVEETLVPVTPQLGPPPQEEFRRSLLDPLPSNPEQLLASPLARWLELTVGIERDSEGVFRRKTPQSLRAIAGELARATGLAHPDCEQKLKELFLTSTGILSDGDAPLFAFKLHQFISQGRSVYATLESPEERHITLDGQYYAPPSSRAQQRILCPVVFCRVCGQEYYRVQFDKKSQHLTPWPELSFDAEAEKNSRGYLLIPSDPNFDWSDMDLPEEWLDARGRPKREYRECIPSPLHVAPDGSTREQQDPTALRAWFQPSPFLICQSCGEYYTRRDKDFRKLTGLSNEGRSSATTALSVALLEHAGKADIRDASRKLLSFTDNRQDASLQAGHFNDFVLVCLLRSAIYRALDQHGELRFDNIADRTFEALGLQLRDFSRDPNLDPASFNAHNARKAFRDLIEYRIYEDLRRAWRVVHPNLEQCGLLEVHYEGLEQCAARDELWRHLPQLAGMQPDQRAALIRPLLDFARKKLAIDVECLRETYQQQLRRRVNQWLNDRWCFDESEEHLRKAECLLIPGRPQGKLSGIQASSRSLIGRYLMRQLGKLRDYDQFVGSLFDILLSQGLLVRGQDRGGEFVRLNAGILAWKKGSGNPPLPDPMYSRRISSSRFSPAQQAANAYFRELYTGRAASLRDVEGLEHTAQIRYENRLEREKRFREGDLKVLFCSPTMELGIDISDLQLVHLRNVPPSPASYAQRCGRAGRTGKPALILTYCSALSGHDQYFFHKREEIVAGAVRPPRIDLTNEDMVRAHMHAVWLAATRLPVERSIEEWLDIQHPDLPLKDQVRACISLSENRLHECIEQGRRILAASQAELAGSIWWRDGWLEDVFKSAAESFDRAMDRWRQLFRAATQQLLQAQELERTSLDLKEQNTARQKVEEAQRQRNLLLNTGDDSSQSDFYPYRYLAGEGFLPGYNFPRLPICVFIPREGGEFISRSRFLAISEFGPGNLIYHEGGKYQVRYLMAPPEGLSARLSTAKLCNVCGYFNSSSNDRCDHCGSVLDGGNSTYANLLEMPNVRSIRRERITCDEEERLRRGYEIATHFRFASAADRLRLVQADVGPDPHQPMLRLSYAPQATLFRINQGWKRRTSGFYIDLATGELVSEDNDNNNNRAPASGQPRQLAHVSLCVQGTSNILLVNPPSAIQNDDSALASLQFALQRAIEQFFQIEEAELGSQRIGFGDHIAILYWEAAEGGAGVLRRLVDEPDTFSRIAVAALGRLHFDPATGQDLNPSCTRACYECLLSYSNQQDHALLNRHAALDLLRQLRASSTTRRHQSRDYEQHYLALKNLTDSRSDLERLFLDHLYTTRRRLPDEAQRPIQDPYCIPDFFYEQHHACIFCDGSVHDDPQQKQKDAEIRTRLRDLGYRVIVIRYDKDLEQQIASYPDIFGHSQLNRS